MGNIVVLCGSKVQDGDDTPVVSPGAESLPERVQAAIRAATVEFQRLATEFARTHVVEGGEDLYEFETELHILVARECCDSVVGAVIRAAHDSPTIAAKAEAIEAEIPHLAKQRKNQTVKVALLGGSEIVVPTPYRLARPPRRQGHPRKRGSRKAEGQGMYPRLQALGIFFRVTPAVASDVARLVVTSPYEEAERTLALQGQALSQQVMRRITTRVAQRGVQHRHRMTELTKEGLRGTGIVRGKRLVISTDGGRLRIRTNERGRPRKSGWHGFKADWKEPKVLVVYEIDPKGKKVRRGLVRYEATMGDANRTFGFLVSLLAQIGAHEASEWIVVADGALWIWDRIDAVVAKLGYDPKKVTKVLDHYHAVEYLHAIADARKGWNDAERLAWVRRMKAYLAKGNIDRILLEKRKVCVGRNARTLAKNFAYLEKRQAMMDYAAFKRRGVPCGSGAVESCVRRLVNLRMKGNGIFWTEKSAEGLLHLRAQFLSGRWSEHMFTILQHESLWTAAGASKAAREAS